jgi:hypothetical protein
MATFLYRCPKTRLRVQGWVADEPIRSEKQNYEAMNCLACGGVHLVNPVSGKTINEDDKNSNRYRHSFGIGVTKRPPN